MIIKTSPKMPKISSKAEVKDLYKSMSILLGLVVIAAILSKGIFLAPNNIVNLLKQNSILMLVTLSQFLIILTGGIDLTVGAVTAISSVMIVLFQDLGIIVSIFAAIAASTLLGATSGVLVTYRRLPSFVVTLAMMQIIYSISKVLCGGAAVYTSKGGNEINETLLAFFDGNLFHIPNPVIVCLIAVVLVSLFIRTSLGHFIYAVGGNENTAYFSGLPVKLVKVLVYAMSALIASVAAILFVSRVGMGDPNTGQWLPLDSIAAVTIGGASLSGGIGTVSGTIIGLFILSVLNNIMSLLNVPPTIQPAIKGVVILIAVYMNSRKKRN
jgi:inositol transport system permease protein